MDRQQAHQLLDQFRDDDDDLTAEEGRAVAASREYFRQNPEGGIPFEQVVAECGLTMDQVRHHQGE